MTIKSASIPRSRSWRIARSTRRKCSGLKRVKSQLFPEKSAW